VSFRSSLFQIAMDLVLIAAEDQKPIEDRLSGFTEASRDSLLRSLLSTAPIYEDLEQVKLADEISLWVEKRGADDELVQRVLDGKSPRQLAAFLVNQTELLPVENRQKVLDGGQKAISESTDPMIRLALQLEDEYRRLRAAHEEVAETERQAYALVTKGTNQVRGTGGYPDATFTLRLAFGVVSGYLEDGKQIQPTTDFSGAYRHSDAHQGQDDFDLPKSWMDAQEKVNLTTQLNFVCTADIIGGNSGSPVVDRNGELVGLIFDGNIQSLTSDYLYTDQQARAVSVSGVGIIESLRSIYGADELADQIGR
ncbi:MAG: S46 family peptidase, partial [Rubripirellula sp.]|nr:S46 family peptidase [Rubripirellula sp.]